MRYKKKGQVTLSQAPGAIQVLIIVGIAIAIAALIITSVRTQIIADEGLNNAANTTSAALNTTNASLSGFDTFGDFIPLIALVVAAAIILGLVRVFG